MAWLGLEPFCRNNVKNNFNAFCMASILLNVVISAKYFILNLNDLREAA